jgi:hypothetical protein
VVARFRRSVGKEFANYSKTLEGFDFFLNIQDLRSG